ncbi:unnamed protein product [Brassica oleracea]
MIYYPSSTGGGMKGLFGKVSLCRISWLLYTVLCQGFKGLKIGNRSSEFHPEVRRVYTVGPEYAHAEARKSPVVDGVVMRNTDGKEVRYPVLLTPAEKQMARQLCIAFRQAVCSESIPVALAELYFFKTGGHFSGIYRKVQLKPLKWGDEGEE